MRPYCGELNEEELIPNVYKVNQKRNCIVSLLGICRVKWVLQGVQKVRTLLKEAIYLECLARNDTGGKWKLWQFRNCRKFEKVDYLNFSLTFDICHRCNCCASFYSRYMASVRRVRTFVSTLYIATQFLSSVQTKSLNWSCHLLIAERHDFTIVKNSLENISKNWTV